MILVMGHIKLGAGEGARLRDTLVEHARMTQAEAGCEFYNFAYDCADPDTVRISERWETPEALAAHGQADHQRAFNKTLGGYKIEGVVVKAWEGGFWRTLIGD